MALLQDNCPITRNENSHIFVINFNPFVLGEILSLFWEESSSIFDRVHQFLHQYYNNLHNFWRRYALVPSSCWNRKLALAIYWDLCLKNLCPHKNWQVVLRIFPYNFPWRFLGKATNLYAATNDENALFAKIQNSDNMKPQAGIFKEVTTLAGACTKCGFEYRCINWGALSLRNSCLWIIKHTSPESSLLTNTHLSCPK